MTLFMNRKKIPKFIWEHKRPHISKMILKRKSIPEGFIVPDFKPSYRAIVIRTVALPAQKQTCTATPLNDNRKSKDKSI